LRVQMNHLTFIFKRNNELVRKKGFDDRFKIMHYKSTSLASNFATVIIF